MSLCVCVCGWVGGCGCGVCEDDLCSLYSVSLGVSITLEQLSRPPPLLPDLVAT